MNLPSVFGTQLPLGKTALLAWLVAAFLSIQWNLPISIQDVTPLEFALHAGFLFGYFTSLQVAARVLAIITYPLIPLAYRVLIIERAKQPVPVPDPAYVAWKALRGWLPGIIARLADVVAMIAAFVLYSQETLRLLAPVGLGISILFYTLGWFDQPETTDHAPVAS